MASRQHGMDFGEFGCCSKFSRLLSSLHWATEAPNKQQVSMLGSQDAGPNKPIRSSGLVCPWTRRTGCRFAQRSGCPKSRLILLHYLPSVGTDHTVHTSTYLTYLPTYYRMQAWFVYPLQAKSKHCRGQLGVSKKAAGYRYTHFLPPA